LNIFQSSCTASLSCSVGCIQGNNWYSKFENPYWRVTQESSGDGSRLGRVESERIVRWLALMWRKKATQPNHPTQIKCTRNHDVDNAQPIGPPIIQVQFKPAHQPGFLNHWKTQKFLTKSISNTEQWFEQEIWIPQQMQCIKK
jgi:hypothetical protein